MNPYRTVQMLRRCARCTRLVLVIALIAVAAASFGHPPRGGASTDARPMLRNSIVGDPAFNPNNLNPEMRKWYDALWAAIKNPGLYPDPDQAAASGDSYFIGRTLNFYVTSLLAAFRVTGDLKLLDEVDRVMEIARAQLKDTNGDGYLNWRYLYNSTSSYYGDDYHEMEEAMAHEAVAAAAYALKANSQFNARYKTHADWWQNYLVNQFMAKWWKRHPTAKYSPLDKTLTHPYAGLMRMYYYLYKLTGNQTYLTEANRRADALNAMMVQRKTTNGVAFTWDHRGFGDDPWGCQPTGYSMHTVGVFIDLAYEGFNRYANASYMAYYAATFRDIVAPFGTSKLAGDVCGAGTERFSLYPISPVPALAQWDSTGKLAALNLQVLSTLDSATTPKSVFIPAYMLVVSGQSYRPPAAATATPTKLPPTATKLPPTATKIPPTATKLPPTATRIPPTATKLPPTATQIAPTATKLPPTATRIPPTATQVPAQVTATPVPTRIASSAGRVTNGLQALYTFEEGTGTTVRDVSGVGTPLNLTINSLSGAKWVPGGLTLSAPTVIQSAGAATKIINTCRTTNELTIEAWVQPSSNNQYGPARIVSNSIDINNRNFTLGQGQNATDVGDFYDVRLRTTTNTLNGKPSLSSPHGLATTQLTHVLYVRAANGTARLYINGVEKASYTAGGNFSNWNTSYPLVLGNEPTNDRKWYGTLYLAAVYCRALSAAEVTQNFQAGAGATSPAPVGPAPTTAAPTATKVLPTATPTATKVLPSATPTATKVPPTPTLTRTPAPSATPLPVSQPGTGRVTNGLQALYTFEEATGTTVRDVSGVGTPLNLTINSLSGAKWVPGGLTLSAPTVIQSAGAATKIINTCRTTNELTIEAWVQPSSNNQYGPARIVSNSIDINNRNFTLGQGQNSTDVGDFYDVRLRTTTNTNNGKPSLSSPHGLATTQLTHVLYVRAANGTARLYINGVEKASYTAGGNFSNWNTSYPLVLGNEPTNDRKWYGTLYLAAVYCRALSAAEVTQNFQAGAGTTAAVAALPTATAVPPTVTKAAPTATPTGVPAQPGTNTPTPVPGTVLASHYFSTTSVFNTMIPAGATYTRETRIGAFRSGYEEWSIPIYRVPAGQSYPLVTVTNTYSGRTEKWPIPTFAQPATGDDHHMAVLYAGSNIVYEMWDAQWVDATHINAGGMNSFPLDGSGISSPVYYRVNAAGFSNLAGMVIREDFINPATGKPDPAQTIDHALTMSLPFDLVAPDAYVPPAVGGESQGRGGSGGVPIGARFALPKTLNVDSLNVHPYTKALLRAARDYGIFVNDTNGAPLYNNKFVGVVALEPGLSQEMFGVSGDTLINQVQSEVYSVIQSAGLYRVTDSALAAAPAAMALAAPADVAPLTMEEAAPEFPDAEPAVSDPAVSDPAEAVTEVPAEAPTEVPADAITDVPAAVPTETPLPTDLPPAVNPATMVVETEQDVIARGGGWAYHGTDLASGGGYIYSSGSPADSLSLTFQGTRVDVIYVLHPALGSFTVELDGVVLQTVPSTAADSVFGARLVIGNLIPGPHTLRILPVSGTVAIDAFEVEAQTLAVVSTPLPPVEPTVAPTVEPTVDPALPPTVDPAAQPTLDPALQPTLDPALNATPLPAEPPTLPPAELPTEVPLPTATPLPVGLPFADAFDSGLGWVPDLGGLWRLDAQTTQGGMSWVADTTQRGLSSLLVYGGPIALGGAFNPQLSFWQKASLSPADWVSVEISLDNGLSWFGIDQQTGMVTDWAPRTVDLTPYAGQTILLRFHVDTTAPVPQGAISIGYWIENVMIQDVIPTPVPTVEVAPPAEAPTLDPALAPTLDPAQAPAVDPALLTPTPQPPA